VVFRTLLPEMHIALGGVYVNSFWIGSVLVLVLTGLYTSLGGMRAVAYNDSVQAVILIIGSALLTTYGLIKLGGWAQLRHICGSEMFNLWKPLVPAGVQGTWEPVKESGRMAWYFNKYFPWPGMLLCAPLGGLWYWCTDQYIVQRALGAANQQTARRGSICAGTLKLLPIYLFIIPGLVCFALAKSGKVPELTAALFRNGTIGQEQAQAAFPLMVQYLLPAGLRGIVVAGLLSALMGSLAGVFNACSTLFTVDLYEKWKPRATQHELVRMGRLAVGVMVLISLAWIPVIENAHGLYYYLQEVQAYLFPPMLVVFFLGVAWKRLNGKGCVAAMIVGTVLGIFRMGVDTPVTLGWFGHDAQGAPIGYAPGSLLWIINNTYFQYFSLLLILISAITMIAVSYMTSPPQYDKIKGLTLGTASPEERRATRESWNWRDVAASVFILLCILGAYVYFRG
jgi:SSS family solute:Na+ symporter